MAAQSLDEIVTTFGDALLNEHEKAQVEILKKRIRDTESQLRKAVNDPKSLDVKEAAQVRDALNADMRIREIRGKAFDRAFGIET